MQESIWSAQQIKRIGTTVNTEQVFGQKAHRIWEQYCDHYNGQSFKKLTGMFVNFPSVRKHKFIKNNSLNLLWPTAVADCTIVRSITEQCLSIENQVYRFGMTQNMVGIKPVVRPNPLIHLHFNA